MFRYSTSKIKSPCTQDCPDRVFGCRETCEKHKEYEAAKAKEHEERNYYESDYIEHVVSSMRRSEKRRHRRKT